LLVPLEVDLDRFREGHDGEQSAAFAGDLDPSAKVDRAVPGLLADDVADRLEGAFAGLAEIGKILPLLVRDGADAIVQMQIKTRHHRLTHAAPKGSQRDQASASAGSPERRWR
jgi:hypothetical protein